MSINSMRLRTFLLFYKQSLGVYIGFHLATVLLVVTNPEHYTAPLFMLKLMQYTGMVLFYYFISRHKLIYYKNLGIHWHYLFVFSYSLDLLFLFILLLLPAW